MKQALILFALFFASTFAYRCGPTDILFLENAGLSVNSIASGILANSDRKVAAYSAPANPETNPFFVQSADQLTDFLNSITNEDVTTLLQGVPSFFAANGRAGSQRVVVLMTTSSTVSNYENAAMLARNLRASGIEIYIYGVSSNSQTAQLASSPAENYVSTSATTMRLLISKVEGRSCLAFGSNPRIGTFDGSSFLFNGVGDYIFYQSSSTYAQIRVEACDMMIPQSRTCITAISVDDDASIYYDPKQDIVTSVDDFNLVTRADISAAADVVEYNYDDFYVYVISGAGLQVEFRPSSSLPNGVTGLCGLYDGCNTNDFVSRDGVTVALGAQPADIYRSFADTWRVQGNSDFSTPIDNEYYWTNYPEYLNNFAPVYAEAPTEQTQSACSRLSGVNSFLYQSCQDAVVAGLTSFQESAFVFAMRQCSDYCSNPNPTVNPFVTASFCKPLCFDGSVFSLTDKYEDANDIAPLDNFQTYGIYSQYSTFLGGTYVFDYKNDNCPSQNKPITLQINCENSARISAGASRTVTKTKNEDNFPVIFVFGSMVDRTTELEYAYQLVDFPKAIEDNNNADRYVMTEGYTNTETDPNLPPVWSPTLPTIEFYNVRSPIASFVPDFPGDYVLELSVYDGCSIVRSNVTISVACDDCALAGQSSPANSLNFEYNGGFDYSSSSSSGGIYQSTGTSASARWLLESVNLSNSTFEFRGEDAGGNRNYYLYVPTEDVIVNVTETVEVTTLQNNTDSPVITTNTNIGTANDDLRVEASDRFSTVTVGVETVTKDTIYYSSIEGEDRKCTITFGTTFDDGTVSVNAEEENFDTDDLYNNVLECLGDYNLVYAMRDKCQDATYSQPLSIRCSDPPVARLTTCLKDLPFDYDTISFASVSLDARDSVDADTTLVYRYDLYAPDQTTPTPMSMGSCTTGPNTDVGSNTYTNCNRATITPNVKGDWRIEAIVFDGCSSSSATSVVTVICESITPVISNAATIVDENTQTITLNSTLTTLENDNAIQGIQWKITRQAPLEFSADFINAIVGSGYPVSAPTSTNEEFSPVFLLQGTYDVVLSVSDGCHAETAEATVTYNCAGNIALNFADVVVEAGSSLVLNGTESISYPDNGNTNYVQYIVPGVNTYTNTQVVTTPVFGNNFVGETITVTITAGNGCRWVQQNITVTVVCPNLIPKPNPVTGAQASYSWDIFNEETITVTPALEVVTLLNGPEGSLLASTAFNASEFTFSSNLFATDGLGTYTILSYVVNCGERLYSDPVTFQVNCAYPSAASFVASPATLTFANGKFGRVSLDVSFTGEFVNNTYKEWPQTDGIWRITFAEMDSVYRPYENDITVTNTTTYSETVKVPTGDLWTSTNTTTNTVTTVSVSREVFLKSIANVAVDEKWNSCFYPDVAGTYTIEFSFNDYCGVRQTSSPVSITTTCNAAPTLTAEDASLSLAGRELGDVLVTLKSNTSDADGDFVYTSWNFVKFTGNNIVSSVTIANSENPVASFRPQYVGEYVFEVTATDGCSSVSQNVTVTVECATPYDAVRPTITFNYDGFNFVPLHKFTLDVSPRCDGPNFDPELVSYTPPQVSPFPAPAPGTTTGAASTVSFSLALIALIALSLIL